MNLANIYSFNKLIQYPKNISLFYTNQDNYISVKGSLLAINARIPILHEQKKSYALL